MSAAILQGVPATTLDTDIWVELPVRRFVRLTEIILRLGGSMLWLRQLLPYQMIRW